ncbi:MULTISPECIES: purine-nucleoside phosphorylase [unclassified Lacrimispora]|uniref:purine-nucleoside phosphorylase n=1 Tax=unclassified Lacrimispora TaxID=2719232 RepID=UPI00376F56DA
MELKAPTHHIAAQKGEIAKTVIMPGDPLRAKYIADHYLEDVREVNSIRCMYAYTGTYHGKEVSVMAHGIGAPSIGVHAWELYNLYDVENIIRVGTAASMQEDLHVKDIVIAMGACYNTPYADQFQLQGTYSAIASYPLLSRAVELAEAAGAGYRVGNVLSSDIFYPEHASYQENWRKLGILCVEMEIAALYIVAARAGKNALGILTMSDHVLTGEKVSAMERQNSFTQMMSIALDMV